MGLSDGYQKVVKSEFKEGAYTQQFKLNFTELSKHIAYKTVELDNGAYLSASTGEFDKVFKRSISKKNNRVTYSTEGKIVSQKVRKSK